MNIRDLLRDLNIEFREHGESSLVTEGWLGLQCPFCGRDSGKHGLGVNLRSLACKCWKCGLHSLSAVLTEIAGIDKSHIWRQIAQLERTGVSETPVARPTGKYTPPPGVGELAPAHRYYLKRRGFDPDFAHDHWGICGIGDVGTHRWRLFIPVVHQGKPSAWTCRAIGRDVEPRYLSSPPEASTVLLKHTLFGAQHARHSVVVVEGPFPAMHIGDGAVAVMGVGYTEAQVALIARYPSRCICFDREPEAQRRANALADSLSVFPGSTYVVNLSGPQPDSSPQSEIDELRKRFLE